jgi:hypothetical protein
MTDATREGRVSRAMSPLLEVGDEDVHPGCQFGLSTCDSDRRFKAQVSSEQPHEPAGDGELA